MQGYNFTERVRHSLARAHEESVRLHHEYVGTEHLLLGLIADRESMAANVLTEFGIGPAALHQAVEQIVKHGSKPLPPMDRPYTSRAKRALELAMSEARELGHTYVGSGHLLLGILCEEKGIGAQVLTQSGLDRSAARGAVRRLHDSGLPENVGNPQRVGRDDPSGVAQPFMRPSGRARLLLSVSAILAWLVGLTMIFNPQGFEAPLGIVVDDKTATIAQAQGALLLGLGAINWIARGVGDSLALRAILYGNFVVQAVSFSLIARALARGLIPMTGIGAAVLHMLLGAAFAWHLRSWRRAP